MKNLKAVAYFLAASLLGIGVATAVTNPNRESYENYATRRITAHLQENTCTDAGLLKSVCSSFLEDNQAQINEFVAVNTKQQNFLFWSIYKTDLSLKESLPSIAKDLIPSYHFETVGIFSSFFTYRAQRIRDEG
ncbi:MAG: DUF4359 domain-containing protein [Cyanobacteria bacterium CRU_2_1]|nr:DUF4359 domain-containing protein [Cyanobacteria bacterium RU_5_0]NJR63726.1 DUF4359 domain-containing protein [Cyanobacteria bacterium CRU_2_1]